MRVLGLTALALASALTLAGCSTGQEAVKAAERSFQEAELVGAKTSTPYLYYAAREYLELAEHEAEESDGKAATSFAERSKRFSDEAVRAAKGEGK